MNTKGQGLPLNLIVLAIIAAIILVIVIAFTVGGAGTTFSRISKAGVGATGDEIETVRNNCRQACATAESTVTNGLMWKQSRYCQMRSSLDLDASGKIEQANEKNIRCWATEIAVDCVFTFDTGGTTKKIETGSKPLAGADCAQTDVQSI